MHNSDESVKVALVEVYACARNSDTFLREDFLHLDILSLALSKQIRAEQGRAQGRVRHSTL
jgi:hypothetical protein